MCLGVSAYERRQPEKTQLYRIIADNWEAFLQERAFEGRDVPKFIRQEFEGFLRCGILACGFGRVCCPTCGVDKLVAFSCKGRGFCPSCGARRMAEAAAILGDELIPLVPVRQFVVTFPPPLRLWLARSTTLATTVCNKVVAALTAHLRFKSGVEDGLAGFVIFMQRFGSAGNLNLHLHIIALDGAYEQKSTGRLKFIPASAPTEESTTRLLMDIAGRINKHLKKKGYLKEAEGLPVLGNTEEIFAAEQDELHLPAQAASVAHRIAFGVHAGKPLRRLRLGERPWTSEQEGEVRSAGCVTAGGYSVHAATAIKSHERERLERLVRYMARPAISEERVTAVDDNTIRLRLKSPWKDGTESLLFTPSEFIEKLIALVPIPRFHLTRYYGVLASRSRHRRTLPDRPQPDDVQALPNAAPQGQGKCSRKKGGKKRLAWAALLKRTFKIDVLTCGRCGGPMTLIHVALGPFEIETTLIALGLSPRAPPIAPARSSGIFGGWGESTSEPWPAD